MADTQEAMHREFETLAPIGVNENFHVYGKRCADFGYKFATAQSAEKIANLGECDECGTPYSYDPTDGGTICVKCMREKIARLEAEKARLAQVQQEWALMNRNTEEKLAAAELSNRQLREVLEDFARGQLQVPNFEVYVSATAKIALAQQPSTEALDAYVAKLIPEGWKVVPVKPTEEMLIAFGFAHRIGMFMKEQAYARMLAAAPLPPAPDQDKE